MPFVHSWKTTLRQTQRLSKKKKKNVVSRHRASAAEGGFRVLQYRETSAYTTVLGRVGFLSRGNINRRLAEISRRYNNIIRSSGVVRISRGD